MSSTTLPEPVKIRLQSHFAFTRLPFRKAVKHDEMFDREVRPVTGTARTAARPANVGGDPRDGVGHRTERRR